MAFFFFLWKLFKIIQPCVWSSSGLHIWCLSSTLDLGMSPLPLRCANDIAWTRLLTLSPLARVWIGISLTCDSTGTHTYTQTHVHYRLAPYRLRWFVTSPSFAAISLVLISSLIFLHLSSTCFLPSFLFLSGTRPVLHRPHLFQFSSSSDFPSPLLWLIYLFFSSLCRHRLNSISDRHRLLWRSSVFEVFSLVLWSVPVHWACKARWESTCLMSHVTHTHTHLT